MRNGELLHRTVRMMDAENLLTHCRKVYAHRSGGYAQPGGRHLKPQETIVVGRTISKALPDDFLNLKKSATIATLPRSVAIGGVVKDDRSALDVLDRILHTMAGGDDGVGAHQGYATGREKESELIAEVRVQDHSHTGRYNVADVTGRRDAGSVFPVRWVIAEPERGVVRFRIGWVAKEGIGVG